MCTPCLQWLRKTPDKNAQGGDRYTTNVGESRVEEINKEAEVTLHQGLDHMRVSSLETQ